MVIPEPPLFNANPLCKVKRGRGQRKNRRAPLPKRAHPAIEGTIRFLSLYGHLTLPPHQR